MIDLPFLFSCPFPVCFLCFLCTDNKSECAFAGHITSVSEAEAVSLAGELGASLFFTSASDGGPSIQAAFTELHRDVVRRRWTRRRRSSAKTVIEGFYKMFSRWHGEGQTWIWEWTSTACCYHWAPYTPTLTHTHHICTMRAKHRKDYIYFQAREIT